MNEEKTKVKPINVIDYKTKQSPISNVVARLPTNQILIAPSNSGKTVLLANYILKFYRGCFEKVFIFSPSIHLDYTWKPVLEYCREKLDQYNTEEDPSFFEEFDEEALKKIITTQRKLIELMKEKGNKKLYQIAILIDDFADDHKAMKYNKSLTSLFVKGRHSKISVFLSSQQYHLLSKTIRVNASSVVCFKLRNVMDLEDFLNEISATVDKKTMLKIYTQCTKEPYSFLFCDLTAKDVNDMFYCNFEKKVLIN